MRQTILPWAPVPNNNSNELEKWRTEFQFLVPTLNELEKIASKRPKCSFKKLGDHCSCRMIGDPQNTNMEHVKSMWAKYEPLLSETLDPAAFIQKNVFIWAPDVYFAHLVPHLTCSVCHCKLRSNGWNESGPQRVYCLGEDYFVLSKQYICTNSNCEKKQLGQFLFNNRSYRRI